jgi:hypothetical protein
MECFHAILPKEQLYELLGYKGIVVLVMEKTNIETTEILYAKQTFYYKVTIL